MMSQGRTVGKRKSCQLLQPRSITESGYQDKSNNKNNRNILRYESFSFSSFASAYDAFVSASDSSLDDVLINTAGIHRFAREGTYFGERGLNFLSFLRTTYKMMIEPQHAAQCHYEKESLM